VPLRRALLQCGRRHFYGSIRRSNRVLAIVRNADNTQW
jgi:hypothetical protein